MGLECSMMEVKCLLAATLQKILAMISLVSKNWAWTRSLDFRHCRFHCICSKEGCAAHFRTQTQGKLETNPSPHILALITSVRWSLPTATSRPHPSNLLPQKSSKSRLALSKISFSQSFMPTTKKPLSRTSTSKASKNQQNPDCLPQGKSRCHGKDRQTVMVETPRKRRNRTRHRLQRRPLQPRKFHQL